MDKKCKRVLQSISACSFLAGALTLGASSAAAMGTTYKTLGTAGQVRAQLLDNYSSLVKGTKAFELKGEEGKCGEGKCGEGKCGEGEEGSTGDDKSGTEGKCGEHTCGEGH